MKKLIEKLEECKGSTIVYSLENAMYFVNSIVESFHYTLEGNSINLYENGEDELIAFKINLDSVSEISFINNNINILFNNGTNLHLAV